MLRPTPYNRKVLKKYLSEVSEDDFVNDIVIPLFHSNGYSLQRRVIDGPGEHGKDVIFYRYVPVYFDLEFVIVQAKATKVSPANVVRMAGQLHRAMTVPFKAKGGTERFANVVMFINAREHTNDAEFEFPYLVGNAQNIRILSQDNILELMLNDNIYPDSLAAELDHYEKDPDAEDSRAAKTVVGNTAKAEFSAKLETKIQNVISSDNSLRIARFLDKDLHLYPASEISPSVKAYVINYIFHSWEQDSSFEGTVRPMRWLNIYFDFIQPEQYPKLMEVLGEYTGLYHSFDAFDDTKSVLNKVTPAHLKTFEDDFIKLVVRKFKDDKGWGKHPLLAKLFEDYADSNFFNPKFEFLKNLIKRQEIIITKLYKKLSEEEKKQLRKEFRENDSALYDFLYPEDKELLEG